MGASHCAGAMDKLIIEARVNEYAPRTRNRHVPWSVQEIAQAAVDCRQAGASMLHFHARQADGSPEHGFESYRDTLAAVRARCDMLIHPTLGYVTLGAPAAERLANIRRMVEEGAPPDIAPMDMGSTNVSVLDEAGRYIPEMEERNRAGAEIPAGAAPRRRGGAATPRGQRAAAVLPAAGGSVAGAFARSVGAARDGAGHRPLADHAFARNECAVVRPL